MARNEQSVPRVAILGAGMIAHRHVTHWKQTGAQVVAVADINPDPAGSYPNYIAAVNRTILFTAFDGTNGTELWKTDGTAAGTVLVKDIHPGHYGSYPSQLVNVNGTAFFGAVDGNAPVRTDVDSYGWLPPDLVPKPGGDYFDVVPVDDSCWSAVVADVSGKGVSSALLASLLQGAFLTVSENPELMSRKLDRISQFLNERTEGGKYATIFYCLLHRTGRLRYINAGHCAPLLISSGGQYEYLEATAMPAGLVQDAEFSVVERRLLPGDRMVIYTDGVTEAENPSGDFFGRKHLRELAVAHAGDSCVGLHTAIQNAVRAFVKDVPIEFVPTKQPFWTVSEQK